MTKFQVVCGLAAKRGESAADAQEHRQELERLTGELMHLDATIRLFDPSYRPDGAGVRKSLRREHRFGSGECQRLVLEVLRDASGPVSDLAIAQRLMARKDFNPSKGLGRSRRRS